MWIDSDKLDWDDEVREVLKHGTLSVGFIGLAETLKVLIGEHHGESERARVLGLEIIGHMRARMDEESKKRNLNFSLLATPAEGPPGRFVKIDKEKYGVIEGVTDREYYTNSFHVPVYYPISAYDKIAIEAPYHALTNAGHISYIEMDGDPTGEPGRLRAGDPLHEGEGHRLRLGEPPGGPGPGVRLLRHHRGPVPRLRAP